MAPTTEISLSRLAVDKAQEHFLAAETLSKEG